MHGKFLNDKEEDFVYYFYEEEEEEEEERSCCSFGDITITSSLSIQLKPMHESIIPPPLPPLSLTHLSKQARGFDPSNLSCDTCELIEESTTLRRLQEENNDAAAAAGGGGGERIDLGSECRTCCRSYKVNPILRPGASLRGKYQAALLTYGENSLGQYGEIKDFVDRDVDDLISFKGKSRFSVVKTQSPGGGHDVDSIMRMYGMMGGGFGGGGGGGPPRLMLFGKQKGGGWTPEDEEEAGEIINLRGWKREDVKDMLMTLLPSS